MGTVLSFYQELFPPAPIFSVDDIPDLSGKVFIVTGGNSGVGKEIVKALLSHNARVYIACRSQSNAQEVIDELKVSTGKEALFLQLDLSDLKSVKESARVFTEKERTLNVLINNAGVMMPPITQLTKDGYDLQFGTHVLGHYYFTKLLLPTLISTAKSSVPSRIVTVASTGALMTGGLNFDTFKDTPARKKLGTQGLYIQSKFGSIVLAQELARRYGDQGIVATSLNPGSLKSNLYRHVTSPIQKAISALITHPVPLGALTPLYVATHPSGDTFNGQFFIPWARPGSLRKEPLDPQLGKELWAWLEEQVAGLD
ncbi:NAD(P)-binding protein [Dendrothele bispora CBS 962.96]|uniref:NAD(P)-binding protein n=1 Tax=Dendrothele bispora (strain CBS 962.96) TaxID=1314807 RepID=A0A4S8MVG7_DENBC|nr:NAD(P)-binding protein [Dendrothele bispora CBS 962.96]